jgi:hypothetical protein
MDTDLDTGMDTDLDRQLSIFTEKNVQKAVKIVSTNWLVVSTWYPDFGVVNVSFTIYTIRRLELVYVIEFLHRIHSIHGIQVISRISASAIVRTKSFRLKSGYGIPILIGWR